MVRIIHFPMKEFQTIEHLIPNFGDRVDDPPASAADQQSLRLIFEDLLGQSARFIQPVLFRSGRLIVYAQAAIWGQHIQHRHASLMDRGLALIVSQQLDKLAAQTEQDQLKQTLIRLAARMRENHEV